VNAFRLTGLANPVEVFEDDPLIARFRVGHGLFADAMIGVGRQNASQVQGHASGASLALLPPLAWRDRLVLYRWSILRNQI
jgi:hypothetical protein